MNKEGEREKWEEGKMEKVVGTAAIHKKEGKKNENKNS